MERETDQQPGNLTPILFPENGDCPKKGSSLDNCKKMYSNEKLVQTKSSEELTEMRKLLLEVSQDYTHMVHQTLTDQYMEVLSKTVKDVGVQSHARYVIKVMIDLCLQKYGHERFWRAIEKVEFISGVLNELSKTMSFRRRKSNLKKMCTFYFDKMEYPLLNPARNSIIRLVDLYECKTPKKRSKGYELHPLTTEFLNYLDEKNQKWQKRARIETTVFLKWYVETRCLSGSDFKEIDVTNIDKEALMEFKRHLEKIIDSGKMTVQTAQTYIQTLRKWFQFLKIKGHIFVNPITQVKNFRFKKEKIPILNLVEIERFFEAILQHGEYVLRDFALFLLMASLGIRAKELLELSRKDINLLVGGIKILRKGGKEQQLPCPGVTCLILELYLKSLSEDETAVLWFNKEGTQLQYWSLRRLFHKYSDLAGISKDVGACHSFRRTLFSELCYQNNELENIKILAGHSLLQHLNPYIVARDSDVKNKFQQQYNTVGGDLY